MSDLEAVRVPPELEPLFRRAEEYVRAYFASHRADPSKGTVEYHGERYIHVRAASLSIEFFDLVRRVYRGHRDADDVARSLLFDVAHAIGLADARDFRRQMGVTEPLEALSAGPVHFAFAGWALVDLSPDCNPAPNDEYLLLYDHPNSFEADAWIKAGRRSTAPVCVMNAGYSSGWSEGSFGIPLVSQEIACRAQGHDACRFVMAPPHRLEEHIRAYAEAHPEVEVASGPVPRLFEQLRKRDEELVHAQRMEAIGRLAGGIAHDFNNLLTVILGCAEQLELSLPAGSSERRNAEAIVTAADRAGTLTRQLLALAKKQVLDLRVVDLAALVRGLVPLLESLLADRVQLVLGELPESFVEVEPRSIEQVLVNLAVNALEAMPSGGALRIGIARDGSSWRLSVADEGVGMDAAVLARAFEPFFTTKEGNSGLGLATARGIVGQFGGALRVESEPGRGTCVHLLLPVADGPPVEPPPAPVARSEGAVVLVVEDDSQIRSMLARFLPLHGYVVHVAEGRDAADALAAELPRVDLVLSDVVMPGGNGPSAVAAVRRHHPAARSLFMTGYAESHIERLPPGAAVIRKPFSLEAVHARLAALLEAP